MKHFIFFLLLSSSYLGTAQNLIFSEDLTAQITLETRLDNLVAGKTSRSTNFKYTAADENFVDAHVTNEWTGIGASEVAVNGNTVTLIIDTTSISEHRSATITAILDNISSSNTSINFDISGTAIINQDYESTLELANKFSIVAGGNGVGTNTNQVSGPEQVAVDSKGSVYVVQNYYTVQKWPLGSLDGETVTLISDSNPITNIKIDASDNIFILRSSGVVEKFNSSFTLLKTYQAPATGGQYFAFDIANDDDETAYIIDFSVEAVLYKTTVASSTAVMNTSSHFAEGLAIYDDQNIFVVGNNMQLSKYNISTKEIKTYPYYYCRDVMLNSDGNLVVTSDVGRQISATAAIDSASILMEIIINDSLNVKKVNSLIFKKDFFDSKNIAVNESQLTESGYEEIGISGVAQDITGNYHLSLSKSSSRFGTNFDNTYEDRVVKYQTSPVIEILAGELQGSVAFKGIEDKLFSEGTETIILTPSASNASLESTNAITINILDNSITLTKTDDPFIGLSNGAVSWGDYDRDGDKDVAIMGSSSTLGAVTAIYRNDAGTFVNTNQDFVKLYDGDITWIDINKDGYLDLVVSGYNQTPQTILYLNNAGISFTQDTTANLPQLFSTKMAWGDLDLDGDIDFAMMGINSSEVLESYIGFKEIDGYKLIKDQFPALVKGALEIADIDLDGDNDLLYSGEDLGANISSSIMINSFIKGTNSVSLPSVSKSSIELINTGDVGGLGILMQGKNSTASFTALNKGSYDFSRITTALYSGDITAGDFDNNGGTDIVITGEDDNGVATTKLYWDWAGAHEEFDVSLEGLRESTAEWVDYDMDGDLDLFLMGLSETGAKTILYKTEVVNKKNTKPAAPSNLQTTDQGFGNVKFTWDAPKDDYSSALGYVVRLGTTKGGNELSNTESDLTTGARLMSKAPSINTNQYETQLDPGTYYWSVQAVDNGLKGSAFAIEGSFELTYAWKSVNQGGIIDYKVATVSDPVLKMVDIDGDDDLDVLYGSQNSAGTKLLQFDGQRLVSNTESKYAFISSAGTLSDIQASDVNGDGIPDIWTSMNNGEGAGFYFSTSNAGFQEAFPYTEYKLYNAKSQIVDLNNDGKKEIISLGLTGNTSSSKLKLYVLELDTTLVPPTLRITDQSDKITTLTASSFDFGDYDGDQDIDFLISGFSASDGLASMLYQNNTEPGGDLSIASSANDFVAVRDGTTDFIDFDSDGDLDVIYTGTAATGDVFEIYLNQLNEGKTDWPKITTNLSGIRNSKIDLGDFNSDGYTDIIYSGTLTGSGEVTKLSEYDPATKQYVESDFDISDIIKATVEFGDIDGDGDLDFSIAGEDKNNAGQYIFRTYRNYRNESAIVEQNSAAGSISDPAGAPMTVGKWSKNVRPTAPKAKATKTTNSPAMYRIESGESSSNTDNLTTMEFGWEAATDDNTPAAGLTYALRIGSKSGGQDVLSSDASGSGLRMSASSGNSGHNLSWNVALPEGTYYWAVQAIDAAYIGSEFSEELSFTLGEGGTTSNRPIVSADSLSLAENSANGTVISTIEATDADGDVLIYSILSGNTDQAFGLDSSTGQLTVANSSALDYETTPAFSLLIRASDGALSDSATFTINLIDVDETINQPPSLSDATFTIAENSPNNTLIGTLEASDINNDTLTYSISDGNTDQAFDLDVNTGALRVANNIALDFETMPVFSLIVRVSDGALNDSAIVSIILTNVDEDSTTTNQAPTITSATYNIAENSVNGTVLGTVEATDPDGDALTYMIVNGNDAEAFNLNSNSGELTVSTSSLLDFETTPTFNLGIEVSDGALSDLAIFTINLTDVEEEEETLSLADASELIYPNPTDGIINIRMASFKEATIYNLSGKIIMRSADNRIDVSVLSEGVYIIKLENRSGEGFSTRLIKE